MIPCNMQANFQLSLACCRITYLKSDKKLTLVDEILSFCIFMLFVQFRGLNSLWPSDAIWWHRSWSTLVQVMACCLTAPSHYLNQCWLIVKYGPVTFIYGQLHQKYPSHQSWKSASIFLNKISFKSLRGQWVKFVPTLMSDVMVGFNQLTHWGRVTHICVSKLTIISSDNGLSPGRRQAIIWTNARISLIGPLGTNFSEILIEIETFSFKKMHLKISSGK